MQEIPLTSTSITYLQSKAIQFRLFTHTQPIHSLEDAAQQRNQTPQQVIRSILFRLSQDQFFMVLSPGPNQIPWKALREYWQQSRLTLASREEVIEKTGYEPGTVNPFGLDPSIPVLIEQCILSLPEISFGSGIKGTAILINPSNLIKALPNAQIINLDNSLC